MNEIDGRLDLRQMRTLSLLLAECSVSRTADILGQSQPTISASLKRLREIFKDPLLVRDGNRLVPTHRGAELREAVTRILLDIEVHFAATRPFDPATDRRFHVLAALSLSTLLLPRIIARAFADAPNAGLHFSHLFTDENILHALREGELDLVLASGPYLPGELRMAPLMQCDAVCVVRQGHPIAEADEIDLEGYYGLAHMTCTPQPMMSFGPIDGQLRESRPRKIAVTAPEFGVVAPILAETDLVFTTARPFAEYLRTIAPLAIVEAPVELAPLRFHMLWHERQHRAPTHKWLRRIVRETAQELQRGDTFRTRRAPDTREIALPAPCDYS